MTRLGRRRFMGATAAVSGVAVLPGLCRSASTPGADAEPRPQAEPGSPAHPSPSAEAEARPGHDPPPEPADSPLSSTAMRTRPIPGTTESLPVIGMGTWQTFDVSGRRALEQRLPVLQAFFDEGGRVIDSSPMYGDAEAAVGALLPRTTIDESRPPFIATKVWTRGRDDGISEMERSIERMGGRVDLMQIHNLVDWRTHLPVLRAWKDEGRIRYLGITHYQRHAFDELEAIMKDEGVDFVQLPYSLAMRDAEARLLPCAEDTGTAVLVMRPFDGGRLFERVKGHPLPAWAAEIDASSWAQVFLGFVLSHPAVTCPIPATSKLDHMRDNMGAGRGRLPDAALRQRMIEALG